MTQIDARLTGTPQFADQLPDLQEPSRRFCVAPMMDWCHR